MVTVAKQLKQLASEVARATISMAHRIQTSSTTLEGLVQTKKPKPNIDINSINAQ